MRRADRLFRIVQRLRRRGGGVVTAATLADELEVSERTVYRDVADLQASGVPVEGGGRRRLPPTAGRVRFTATHVHRG